ncbi:hypothetical protein NQ315_006951 [Exocentrus adspersus]|uniref:Uncharacterized protein n=1 Tax=Exocentrus adspersus TaxID=1586481 RepID=A0AAV8WC22_9CUCU|nr:hypothetical protein NQ315_006951 [Exocentrus adspersus]
MRACVIIGCIASFLVLVQGLSEDDRKKIKAVHEQCQSDPATKVDNEVLKKYHKGENVDKSIVSAHILCMSTGLGLIDEQGKVKKDNLRKALSRGITDEAKLDEVTEKCAVEKDKAEDTAIGLLKCFRENVDQSLHGDHNH